MKAIVYRSYGKPGVLQPDDIQEPIPRDNEILVKVRATSVTFGDTRMRSFNVPNWQWIFARIYLGLFKPKRQVLGMELSGEVEAVGKNVTRFKAGDQVFASTLNAGFGAYAEYKCFPENGAVALKPDNLAHVEAAVMPIGAGTALRFLRNGKVKSKQKVLIYGASGSVGTYAVQLAKYFGAEVTGVCSTSNTDLVKSIGADHVIDYTKEAYLGGEREYDVIFDAVGKADRSGLKSSLKKGGVFLSVSGDPGKVDANDLGFLRELAETNKIKPVIEKEFSLDQVAEAHEFVERGRKKGNVAVRVD